MSPARLDGEVVVVADAAAVADEAARRFADAAEAAIAARGRFSVALSGGSTPKALYRRLAAEPYRSRVDWSRVDVLFGDERTVPPTHADSNYGMAREALLGAVPARVLRIEGERPADEAARDYEAALRRALDAPTGVPRLDLVLLGVGPDGHTASLFPGTAALDEQERLVVANRVEALGTVRVTLTAPLLSAARAVLVLAAGADKAAILAALPGSDPRAHPVLLVRPAPGAKVYLLDRAAAVGLA